MDTYRFWEENYAEWWGKKTAISSQVEFIKSREQLAITHFSKEHGCACEPSDCALRTCWFGKKHHCCKFFFSIVLYMYPEKPLLSPVTKCDVPEGEAGRWHDLYWVQEILRPGCITRGTWAWEILTDGGGMRALSTWTSVPMILWSSMPL